MHQEPDPTVVIDSPSAHLAAVRPKVAPVRDVNAAGYVDDRS
jgi:hypothetical protein